MHTINKTNTSEILAQAGLNFNVFQLPTVAVVDDEHEIDLKQMANCRMIMDEKGNTKPHVLGLVSPKYQVVQNEEALSVFDPLFENGLVTLERADSFGMGAVVFIQARVNTDSMEVVKGDVVTPYILLAHSHDGSIKIYFGFCDERVTCKNSLNRILANKSGKNKLLRFKHKKNVVAHLDKARDMMDIANQQFIATVETYREMAKVQVNSEDLKKYVKQVFSVKSLDEQFEEETEEERKSRILDDLEHAFTSSPGNDLPGAKGSLWSLYNAVTFYTKYVRGNKNTTDEKRLQSVLLGDANRINQRALDLAVSML